MQGSRKGTESVEVIDGGYEGYGLHNVSLFCYCR